MLRSVHHLLDPPRGRQPPLLSPLCLPRRAVALAVLRLAEAWPVLPLSAGVLGAGPLSLSVEVLAATGGGETRRLPRPDRLLVEAVVPCHPLLAVVLLPAEARPLLQPVLLLLLLPLSAGVLGAGPLSLSVEVLAATGGGETRRLPRPDRLVPCHPRPDRLVVPCHPPLILAVLLRPAEARPVDVLLDVAPTDPLPPAAAQREGSDVAGDRGLLSGVEDLPAATRHPLTVPLGVIPLLHHPPTVPFAVIPAAALLPGLRRVRRYGARGVCGLSPPLGRSADVSPLQMVGTAAGVLLPVPRVRRALLPGCSMRPWPTLIYRSFDARPPCRSPERSSCHPEYRLCSRTAPAIGIRLSSSPFFALLRTWSCHPATTRSSRLSPPLFGGRVQGCQKDSSSYSWGGNDGLWYHRLAGCDRRF